MGKLFKTDVSAVVWMTILFVVILGVAGWVMVQYMYEMQWAGDPSVVERGFWLLAYFAVIMVGLVYYAFTRDLSETVAILAVFTILVHAGLQDIMFYGARWFELRMPIDAEMCWLKFPMNSVSTLMGESCVTPMSLFLNVILGAIIAYFVYTWLVKQKW